MGTSISLRKKDARLILLASPGSIMERQKLHARRGGLFFAPQDALPRATQPNRGLESLSRMSFCAGQHLTPSDGSARE